MILLVGDVVDDIGVRPLGRINPASDTEAEIRMTCGGSAANVAAWLGHLGAPARFVGRAGIDGVQRHTGALTAHGVDARIGADPHLPTATIVLTLDDAADRTMFVDRAANTTLTPDHLTDGIWADVTWLHLTGYTYFDEATRPVALAAVTEARRRGIGVSVDPSSLGFLEATGRGAALRWFADADLVFPNEDEQRFLDVDDAHAVETRGAAGARFRGHALEAVEADVIDTTGAGDAFCAGFLSVWSKRSDPEEALAAGVAAAAQCVTLRGARPVGG